MVNKDVIHITVQLLSRSSLKWLHSHMLRGLATEKSQSSGLSFGIHTLVFNFVCMSGFKALFCLLYFMLEIMKLTS